ncbi:MAG: hypothetical protein LBM00_00050 [Deltaproteobacteria bacterium]|jgi:hypothetical protein|nr:hypothetical protein [Deltaproteobacteria bacterium]
MIPIECKKLEDCFISRSAYHYRFEEKLGDAFVDWLEGVSSACSCRRDFPRPFFNAALPDGTQVKGVLGDTVIKVVYPDGSAEESKTNFETLLMPGGGQ